MSIIRSVGVAIALALTFPLPALAQDAELAKIREEIKQIKNAYEKRIQALEKRLAETETKAGKAEQSAASAESAATAAANRAGVNAFNPAISMVLQGTYARMSQDPGGYHITGFMPSGGEVGPPKRSFGLAETELALAANIDPYFRGVAIASLAPEGGAAVEEAYFQTLALPQGLTLKGGRFFSGIGYQNGQHRHAWDFQDAPLPYKAFLGTQLKQDGLQLKWIAPTDLFVELGAELSSGDQFPGNDRMKNGIGGSSIFGHIGGDIGSSYAWQTGLSYFKTSAQNRSYQDADALSNPVTNAFTGDARLWVADAVLKWAPNGNSTSNSFRLQGEYFRLKQDGQLTYNTASPASGHFDADQSGYYLQGVWQFMPRWRIGYRYDALRYGTVNNGIVASGTATAADFPLLANYSPSRNTLMFDWSATEFSRIRLQLGQDKSRLGATDNQVFVQYLYSLGAHGAHKF